MSKSIKQKTLLKSAEMYEQILARIPQDNYSLEQLKNIYRQLGEKKKLAALEKNLQEINTGDKPTPIKVEQLPVQQHRTIKALPHLSRGHKTSAFKSRPSIAAPIPPSWRRKTQSLSSMKATVQLEEIIYSLPNLLKNQVDLLIALLENKVVTEAQFTEAMNHLAVHRFARNPTRPYTVVHILNECKEVDATKISQFLKDTGDLPQVDLSKENFDSVLFEKLPVSVIFNYGLFIFKKQDEALLMAVVNPLDLELLQHVALFLNRPVRFYQVDARDFSQFIRQNYRT